jgi:hypothetical protein
MGNTYRRQSRRPSQRASVVSSSRTRVNPPGAFPTLARACVSQSSTVSARPRPTAFRNTGRTPSATSQLFAERSTPRRRTGSVFGSPREPQPPPKTKTRLSPERRKAHTARRCRGRRTRPRPRRRARTAGRNSCQTFFWKRKRSVAKGANSLLVLYVVYFL